MNRVDFARMSDDELKQYFLKHRGNKLAFQTYLERINRRPLRVIASLDDPDFDQKVQAAIQQKLDASRRGINLKANVVLEPPENKVVEHD